jgi:Mg-chelatase subunit ChlD
LITRSVRSVAVLAALLCTACKGDSAAPPDPRGIRNVLVGVRVNPTTFEQNGQFDLAIVPVNGNGQAVLSTDLDLTASLNSPAVQPLTPVADIRVEQPDSRPTAAAINIDDSRSTTQTDPHGQRAAASRLFYEAVLAQNASNQVAILGFASAGTNGFKRTMLWQDWSSDKSLLDAALGHISGSGDTFLYESITEVATWVNATKPASQYRRAMLLVTDGDPTDPANAASAIKAAADAGIPVYTVGIGPGSDKTPNSSSTAVGRLQAIANGTGGVYAGMSTPDQLSAVFRALAAVQTQGALLMTVQLSPIPQAGTSVAGNVHAANEQGEAIGSWSFAAP